MKMLDNGQQGLCTINSLDASFMIVTISGYSYGIQSQHFSSNSWLLPAYTGSLQRHFHSIDVSMEGHIYDMPMAL